MTMVVNLLEQPFLHMLCVNGIKDVTATVKNPQANAICEQLHQSVGNPLQTILHTYPPNNIDHTKDIMDTCFTTATYASKVAIYCTLNMSPGALVFKRYDIEYTSHHRFASTS
jgi:hypothetical protein